MNQIEYWKNGWLEVLQWHQQCGVRHKCAAIFTVAPRAGERSGAGQRCDERVIDGRELPWASTREARTRSVETGEVSWATKRRVVEALVAGIEVESAFDPMRKRGQQRAATLHISYRFEEPEMEQKRTGKSPRVVAGLSLTRSHLVVAKTEARKDERVEWVRKVLEEGKAAGVELRIEDVIEGCEESMG